MAGNTTGEGGKQRVLKPVRSLVSAQGRATGKAVREKVGIRAREARLLRAEDLGSELTNVANGNTGYSAVFGAYLYFKKIFVVYLKVEFNWTLFFIWQL